MSALNIKKGSTKHSAYNLRPTFSDVQETHTLACLWTTNRVSWRG